MKKLASLVLAFCLTFGLTAQPAFAASSDSTSVQQTVQALGIIVGDGTGNLNLSGNVTRAQFAKMIIAASKYKDTISKTASSSPFKDVSYQHWAASYIQAAVTAQWLTGYTDGTYRPDNYVTLEEAVSAVLKLLGYTSTDFSGSFPQAQLATYAGLGLNANITKTQGQILSRQDCMNLFYNLMSTKIKNADYYAKSLNYTVNTSGKLDYNSLVMKNMQGPFVVTDSSWSSSLPFTAGTAAVYINGAASSLSSVATNDVYYYNTGMNTVWVYRNQISGVYTAASPSSAAPTSVTVAGNSYTIAEASAAYALSDLGNYHVGSSVTLLLGMNGYVVGVSSPVSIDTTKYGVIIATGTQTYTDTLGTTKTATAVTVGCTDGNTYKYEYDNYNGGEGALVQIDYSNGTNTITQIGSKTISGTVNSAGTALGSYSFADDIQILDTTTNGSYLRIYPSRIAGLAIASTQVRYYVLDGTGKISKLILNDVTGDYYKAGIITSTSNFSYTYLIDGVSSSAASASAVFSVTKGPAEIEIVNSKAVSMTNLTSVSLTAVNTAYAAAGTTRYALGDNVAVYVVKNGSSNLSNIAEISTSTGYTLTGYYDKLESVGGRIRLIIATAN